MRIISASARVRTQVRFGRAARGTRDEVVSKKGDEKTPRRGDSKQWSGEARNVGDALRAVYHDAAAESVPDEMLELIKKLG